MDSKLRSPALRMGGWGLLHGDFFDLYDVVEVLEMPNGQAGEVMIYLRSMKCVELVAEVRRGLKEEKKVHKRIFIKVLCIHPEAPPKPQKLPPAPKSASIQQQLTELVRFMPSPRGVR
ncbi:hypothetical protein [Aeromonas hydrophila]|uniref:hypothetical protein n=1 Tax=Aeromonas hydrophila TaxID=644 RepID=UPI001A8D62CF|nr:hypothetical protein [Aeromonas hydrophila]UMQ35962.1 hypothetical protein MJ578_12275 [Aeromonas hydrophila]UMQ44496.1 hypothetical protein MJ573_12280 [Aeromonas hydrophila]